MQNNTEMKNTSESMPPLMVDFNGVSLCFQREGTLLETLFSSKEKLFWALRDVSFQIYEGDTLGVVGRNGSGKSTLSMVCTKIYQPDKGSVSVQGRVQLLALGVGFERQLTGRENVYIGGTLLGLKKTEITQKMPEIEAFADIGDFIDEPVRTYSSGMKSRLAFAIATATKPDILILDEVMATGDSIFRKKAMDRMKNLQAMARCAMIISHSPGQLEKLCNKALWLEKGQIVMYGRAQKVLRSYKKFCNDPDEWKKRNVGFFTEISAPSES